MIKFSENILWKPEANQSLVIACLKNYQKPLWLATFRWVHSISRGIVHIISILTWRLLVISRQKNFLWTKFLKNLLLVKYLVSATMSLIVSGRHLTQNIYFECQFLINFLKLVSKSMQASKIYLPWSENKQHLTVKETKENPTLICWILWLIQKKDKKG